jgi:uncharacterized membrane protein YfcA
MQCKSPPKAGRPVGRLLTPGVILPIVGPGTGAMNFKLLFKTLLTIALLALLVIMGMNNRQSVDLTMPHILPRPQHQPAALMYFAFFGIGFLSGTLLMAGGRKGGGRSGKVQT